jgi:hypothetical protein
VNAERKAHKGREARAGSASAAGFAFLMYVALTVAMTWPLARGLTRDVPGDFGDPLFTSWVLAWDVTHLGRGWLDANIFYPHPLALAYSEHFLPQALQILPIYAATKNPILCYNLLFLSTFVLSGLGMFLLGRELTGSRTAGFVAGLAYAFTPYRVTSLPHLQVLSAAWLPFVVFGLRRFFATGRLRPLAGAAAAWIAQNLSCGYYLVFFSPALVFYIVWEITTRGLWRERRIVLSMAAACAMVFIVTAPFLLPYLELRRLGFNPRSLGETERFSADVYAYFTADPNLRIWGPIARAWPRAEGLLFPGLTISLIAVIGAGADLGRPRAEQAPPLRMTWAVVAIAGVVISALLLGWSIRLPGLRITSFPRALAVAAGAGAIFLAVSARARLTLRGWLASPAGLFSAITLFAVFMSFGPEIHARGRLVAETNIYAAFFRFVPGFDGLRVPARYAMLVTFGLAALAALGVAALERRNRRWAGAVASVLIVLESLAVPMPINQNSADYKQTGLAPLPPSVATGAGAPEVYRFIAELPASAVIVELPLGEPAFDIRYMFYSTTHWKPLVNGYSGGAPQEYEFLTESLKDAETRPDRAWDALMASGATHAIVHESFYADDRGPRLSDWIRRRGGRDVAAFGTDHAFQLR